LATRQQEGEAAAGKRRGSQLAPALAGLARKLERNIITDNLNQQLWLREERDTLQKQNKMPRDDVAPRLQGPKAKLEQAFTRDKVGHLLEQRSEIDELQSRDVLKDVKVAPALQSSQRTLMKNLTRSNLYHALAHRPSVGELIDQGVYPKEYLDGLVYDSEDEYDDGEYNQQFDGNDDYGAYEEEAYDQPYDMQGEEQYYEDEEGYYDGGYEQPQQMEPYQQRSKDFHLTRILLKFIASMSEAGEISIEQKGYLKDLVVDQDQTILAVAETFDADNDINDFKDSLLRMASRG